MPEVSVDQLKQAVESQYGGTATLVQSVPVIEGFRGATVWEGIVEVFDLHDHPTASVVYAWTHKTDNPESPRHVMVLHVDPVTSPELAVRAAIVQEFRKLEPEEG